MARILLIDDDPVIVRIYASRLGTDGHAVTTAGSAAEAFAALAAGAPDLVLLDLMLPDRPGVEVLRELRARPATAQVPVVVLSNAYLAEDMAAARSAGASAVAAKATCGPRQVGELVRRHLEPAPAPRPPATADPVVAPVTLPAFTAPVIGSEEQAGQRIVTSVLAEVRRDLPGLRKATPAVQREALGRLHRRLQQVIGAATVAGRSATEISAWSLGQRAARWWLDDETGIVLWQELYDGTGAVALSVGFTSVTVMPAAEMMDHLPPRLLPAMATTSLSVADATWLEGSGWTCGRDLSGLSLVRLHTDSAVDPSAVQAIYSDGVATVAVLEQRGRLDGAPAGTQWDPDLRAYVRRGASQTATWQANGAVLTVVTDGPADVLTRAVASLPLERSAPPTTMDRVREGWASILAELKG